MKERAVGFIIEHQGEYAKGWSTIFSTASKTRCTPETHRAWYKQAESTQAKNAASQDDTKRVVKQVKGENRELKRANQILYKAAAFFAQTHSCQVFPCNDRAPLNPAIVRIALTAKKETESIEAELPAV